MAKSIYVVLNDGDTFSPINGCKIVTIDESQLTDDQSMLLDNGGMLELLDSGSDAISVVTLGG